MTLPMEIFGTKELPWNGESWDTTLYTHHKLLREKPYEGVTGGKTGFVPEAGVTRNQGAGPDINPAHNTVPISAFGRSMGPFV